MQNNENILEEFDINELEDRVEFGLCGGGGGGDGSGDGAGGHTGCGGQNSCLPNP